MDREEPPSGILITRSPRVESHGYHTNETAPVYDAIAQDPSIFRFLTQINTELAAETRRAGCQSCPGRLHVADFPRKPRGCPAAVA